MPRKADAIRFKSGYGFFSVAGLVCFAIITCLTVSVTRDLRQLNSASSDNVQWSLSQTEVEFLEFNRKIAKGEALLQSELGTLRRAFDVFYSRISTLEAGSVYADLRQEPGFAGLLADLRMFLDETVPLIDGDDAALIASLPALEAKAESVHAQTRALSIAGLSFFANSADKQRTAIAVSLTRLATIVAALVLILVAFVYYVSRLNVQNMRRSRESELASTRMNTITSTALDGVIVTDANGRIIEFNGASEEMFGHASKDVLGKTIGSAIVPDHFLDAHEAGMERMRQNGEKRVVGKGRIQLEAKRKDGEIFPVELAIQSAETDDGEIFIAFLRDISKRIEGENELIKARDKALAGERAKSDFLAVMSHEIRTPLNGLLGNLELLEDTSVDTRQAKMIGNMKTSGQLLMRHVTGVLDISRYDAGKLELNPEPLALNSFLNELIDNQAARAAEQNTSLECEWIGPSIEWVNADRGVLQIVLLNLIGNAVKFTKDGAVMLVAETLSVTDSTAIVELRVADTGVGIDEAALGEIFNDFTTGNINYNRKVGGTGLGLGIAKRFATALGGDIGCESVLGEGSLFWIRVPLQIVTDAEVIADKKTAKIQTPAMNILVVEDNEINRQVVRAMLLGQGHHVTEAVDGASGVERAHAQRFDLILMDISMPVMDGREATRAIRSGCGASFNVPIVALTANAMQDERAQFLRDGMNDVLSKPLTRVALSSMILVLSNPETSHVVHTATGFVDLDQLAETQDALGDALFSKTVSQLKSEAEAFHSWLSDAPTTASAEIAARAHKMAAAASLFGAVGYLSDLKALEQDAKSGTDMEAASVVAESMSRCWADTLDHLGIDEG